MRVAVFRSAERAVVCFLTVEVELLAYTWSVFLLLIN